MPFSPGVLHTPMAGLLILWLSSSCNWLASSYNGLVPLIDVHACTYMQNTEAVGTMQNSYTCNIWVGLLSIYLPNCITHSIFCSYHPTGHHILHISICYNYPSHLAHSPLWFGRHSKIYSVLDRASRTGWRVGDHTISLLHHCGTFPSNWL